MSDPLPKHAPAPDVAPPQDAPSATKDPTAAVPKPAPTSSQVDRILGLASRGSNQGTSLPGVTPLQAAPAVPPDWAPSREAPMVTPPTITVDPPGSSLASPLGGVLQRTHEIHGLARAAKVTWKHEIDGERKSQSGIASTLAVFAHHAGSTHIESGVSVQYETGRHAYYAAPSVELVTARSVTEISDIWASSQRATIPIVDLIQRDEDVILTGRTLYVAPTVEDLVGHIDDPAVRVKEIQTLGPKTFRAVLHGFKPGAANTLVRIAPKGVAPHHIVPASLNFQVSPSTADDLAGRPADALDAADRIKAQWGSLYDQRIDGLDVLMSQLGETDPAAPKPLWQELLKGAALVALGAATAGIGVAASRSAMMLMGAASEAWQEAVKVLVEDGLSGVIVGGVERGFNDAMKQSNGGRTGGGTALSLKNYFQATQLEALRDLKVHHTARAHTAAKVSVRRLERNKDGSGYRSALLLAAAIDEQRPVAFAEQLRASLQAWASLLAQVRLGTTQPQGSTNLGPSVTAARVISMGPGLDPTPGVLRLELGVQGPRKARFFVKRALIEGFTNDRAVDPFHKIPVGELRLPIVARFNEDPLRGFVIGRNERRVYFASTSGEVLGQRAKGGSKEAAARDIFEQDLDPYNVVPRRG